jgi:hypothetical protein
MVPTDFSAVVEGVALSTMQIDQQNKEIRRAEELITSGINQLEGEKEMKLFIHSVHSVTLYRQIHTLIFRKKIST